MPVMNFCKVSESAIGPPLNLQSMHVEQNGGSNVGNTIAECLARNSKADCNVNSQLDHTNTKASMLGSDDPRCETTIPTRTNMDSQIETQEQAEV